MNTDGMYQHVIDKLDVSGEFTPGDMEEVITADFERRVDAEVEDLEIEYSSPRYEATRRVLDLDVRIAIGAYVEHVYDEEYWQAQAERLCDVWWSAS